MAGFGGNFNGRLRLLRPSGQGKDEQHHNREVSHSTDILDATGGNANGKIKSGFRLGRADGHERMG
jgi:hypothetical protein